ncbi:Vps62-related protein [Streptomyces sp. AP-93]|uniref:Vps62-related protein n=1 Tax=Streptomyces sp. AP-93 TaxID=2929048 RepID=UPI001FAEB408|nr:Vps62-related protein [Streptomyces sp. AP-93]MCJ0872563.1 Vps62-related protein [Streptomyces sp. AP-93]
MAEKSMAFGELTLAFTDKMDWCWDDEDSGGKHWVSFWQPVAPAGFKVLGTVVIPAWGSANLNPSTPNEKVKEHVVALVVKENPEVPSATGKPALANPVDYVKVWDDAGTGAKYKGCIWRPVAPDGYVAMGCVTPKDSYDKPALDAVACVREDLTFISNTKWVYSDKGAGGKHDLSVWRNVVPPSYVDNTEGLTRALIAANTFAAFKSYEQPQFLPEMRVLCLPMPIETPALSQFPELADRTVPAPRTPEIAANAVWVPFTAINDSEKPTTWKLANSPFYKLQRKAAWSLVRHLNNNTEVTQKVTESVTIGIEKEQISTFEVSTGISVTATAGVSTGFASAELSTTYSLSLGFGSSTGLKEIESRTVSKELVAVPGTAAAMWVGSSTIQVVRADNSRVGVPLTFKGETDHYDQYPDKA